MNINFELYKTFYSVAKNQNITKAARELMISQPAVSKSIKTLEEQLNCSLFIRNKYGVTLTSEGQLFYENIKPAIEMIEHAEDELQETLNLEYGTLSLGVSNSLTQNYLLPYIKIFHEKYPNIKIKISTSPTFQLITQARNGLIDFIILNLPYKLPSDFKEQRLKEIHDCFIANNNWSELKSKTIDLEKLQNYPLILLAKGSNTRTFLDEVCEEHNILLNPEMELASYSLVVAFTKIGLGLGYATKEFIQQEIDSKELFEIKTNPQIPPRSIGVTHLKQKQLNKASLAFLDILKEKKRA